MFKDRKEAGQRLGQALEKYRNERPLVLGIARGGVETAYYVARHLDAPELSVVIARKLGYPQNPEFAMGAVSEDGDLYLFPDAIQQISQEVIKQILNREKEEIKRRIKDFRQGNPLPEMRGKTVIITDDGIARGSTLFVTIDLCKNRSAGKIIVAAPVAGEEMEDLLSPRVDEAIILSRPPLFRSVSQEYRTFGNVTTREVQELMRRWEEKHHQA